jgi:hypothetical protein
MTQYPQSTLPTDPTGEKFYDVELAAPPTSAPTPPSRIRTLLRNRLVRTVLILSLLAFCAAFIFFGINVVQHNTHPIIIARGVAGEEDLSEVLKGIMGRGAGGTEKHFTGWIDPQALAEFLGRPFGRPGQGS